jgi:hypothetical protein
MRRYLLVANQTLGGDHLIRAVRERLRKGPSEFWVLVPAARPVNRSDADDYGWTESGERLAQQRLDVELQRLREAGAKADGEVGDANPYKAVSRTLADHKFDEIILSTLPRARSRWLRQDLPRRLQRLGTPVTQVVSE